MLGIPRRLSHFVFAVMQSGITSMIASGVASAPLFGTGRMLANWTISWALSWALMLPVVILAAPFLRRAALALTKD